MASTLRVMASSLLQEKARKARTELVQVTCPVTRSTVTQVPRPEIRNYYAQRLEDCRDVRRHGDVARWTIHPNSNGLQPTSDGTLVAMPEVT